MTLLVGLAILAAAAQGSNDFTLVMPVSPETPEGQRLLADRARQICGPLYPVPGRYRFSGRERVSPDGRRSGQFEVVQELTCADSPPVAAVEEPAPADWRATARDEEDARAATMRYFAAVDAGDAIRVQAMWSPAQQAEMPLEVRSAQLRRFREEAGRPGAHRIARLTWYVNPPGAPRPGIYVAADYERAYSGLRFNCGYLIWFRQSEGRYVLIREETSTANARDVEDSPEAIAQARTLSRCPA